MTNLEKNRRNLIATLGACLTPMVAGCTGGDEDEGTDPNEDTNEDGTASEPSPPESDDENPTDSTGEESPPDAIEPQQFEGSGTEVIQNVTVEPGLVVASAEQTDPEYEFGNFGVFLVDAESEGTRSLFQGSGEISGRGANVVGNSEYHLEVDSAGDWSVELSQPRASTSEAEEPPIDISGTGSTVEGPFLFDGRRVVEGTNDAEGDFIVTVWPMEGPWGEYEIPILKGGVGTFEATMAFDGIAWIDVVSRGSWELTIE